MTVSENSIRKAYELAEIDAFYVETPYSKEKTAKRLDLLDWFRGWCENEEGDIYWDRNRNWLCDDLKAYYNDKIFDLKYSNVVKTPLIVKWVKILSMPKFKIPQSEYQKVAEDLEKIELENIKDGVDLISSKLREYIENKYEIAK